jgi:lysophospholipid acyltransferase (LPLAT)-like uncharacterized protein
MTASFTTPLLSCGARAAYALLRRSVALQIDDRHAVLLRARGGDGLLFACRHGQLVPLLWAMEGLGLSIVVSRSRDGELLARVLRARGFGLIRGSSSRDGRTAAHQVLRALAQGVRVGLAVDGPRGPCAMVQDGVLRLAQSAGTPVVPLRAHLDRSWIAPGSWDCFEVPLPGSRVAVQVGPAVTVDPGPEGLDRAGALLALALGGWRAGAAPARVAAVAGVASPRSAASVASAVAPAASTLAASGPTSSGPLTLSHGRT